jgi:hypothetical protein
MGEKQEQKLKLVVRALGGQVQTLYKGKVA